MLTLLELKKKKKAGAHENLGGASGADGVSRNAGRVAALAHSATTKKLGSQDPLPRVAVGPYCL